MKKEQRKKEGEMYYYLRLGKKRKQGVTGANHSMGRRQEREKTVKRGRGKSSTRGRKQTLKGASHNWRKEGEEGDKPLSTRSYVSFLSLFYYYYYYVCFYRIALATFVLETLEQSVDSFCASWSSLLCGYRRRVLNFTQLCDM
jgi:hypothetical protein